MAIWRSTWDFFTSGQSIPIYVYEIKDRYINKTYVKYNSITEASRNERVARGTMGVFKDTNVPHLPFGGDRRKS